LSNLFVDKISGKSGTSSGAPITLSGDTATLGSGVTIPAAGVTGTLGSGVTFQGTFSGDAGQKTCKAWVNFNGTGTVAIRDSYNVTSITDQTTGDYSVNFASTMPTANYCMQLSCGGAAVIMIGGRGDFATSQTTTTCRIGTRSSTSSQNWFDEELVNVVIFGD